MSIISVVVPTYGRPDLLRRCLQSISRQDYRNFEVLVVDDCSPQKKEYAAVIDQYAKEFPLHYHRNQQNMGPQIGRNWGIREAKGEYVAFVDDDDEWLPSKLRKQIVRFEEGGENLGIVYSWADAFNEAGICVHNYRSRHCGSDVRPILESCFLPSPTVVVKRSVLVIIGGWDEGFPSCQDWDLWTRIVAAGFAYAVVEEVLAHYHMHIGFRIGNSARALEGFKAYYRKHEKLYRKHGMAKVLSEKERGLASLLRGHGDNIGALEMLRCAVREYPMNWKAWLQLMLQKKSV